MSSYASIEGHRSMVYDEIRNAAYAAALEQYVHPKSVVLDLGSGLGIHGLMAAAQGAKHVYLVDPSPVNSIAKQVADGHGLARKVTCIQKPIERADLPEKVDLIVSVFTGNFLLEEDLLPSLFFARDKYLKPDGVLIPDCGEMRAAPVCAPEFYAKYLSSWSENSQGIDFSPVRQVAANRLYHDSADAMASALLADAQTIAKLDFFSAEKAACLNEVSFTLVDSGACHGFLGWFKMRLGGEWLSTSPVKPAMHWSQVFMPLDPPFQVIRGETVSLRVIRPQFGDWTWFCTHHGNTQKHSTFFSRNLTPEQLRCHLKEHPVQLNERGELVSFVINQMTGGNTIQSIFELTAARFEHAYSSPEELEKQVQSIISDYGM